MSLPQHYAPQFASNIELGLQQKQSKLESAVMSGMHRGKSAQLVDIVGALEMQEMVGRNEPIHQSEADVIRRWVSPKDYDLSQLIGDVDKIRMLADPTSKYVENALAAARRKKDRMIIAGFFRDAKVGEEGTDNRAFFSNNIIAPTYGSAGGVTNTGLNVKKIRAGKLKLLKKDVDLETDEIYLGLTPEQGDNLFDEIQITSSDYNGGKPVFDDKGMVQRFMGVTFIYSNLFELDANGFRRNPMWVKSGMYFGNWMDATSDVSQRKDLKGLPWQAYVQRSGGATRLEEEKVVEIKNAELA